MQKLLILFFCCLPGWLQAQVIIQFIPEIQGRTADGLLWAKLSNLTQQPETAVLDITVTEKKNGRIISLSTPAFSLLPGVNTLSRGVLAGTTIRFADNNLARLLRQSAVFPEGEYEYCFTVYRSGKTGRGDLLGEQCFNYLAEPLTPLFLIEPYHKAAICDKRPSFSWQPSMPVIPGLQYRLTLVEMKPGQVAQEALVYNLPLINQPAVTAPVLLYPPAAKELEEGRLYTWQVTAYKENVILNRSEIWEFSIKCNDTPGVEPATGFRDIEDLAKGNYYIADGKVLFSVYNAYEETGLTYSFFCLNKPDQVFKKLPAIKLKRGNNNITIDLNGKEAFVDGFHYVLTVRLPNHVEKKLRFLYKSTL